MVEGRITKGVGGLYFVSGTDGNTYECSVRGIFRKQKIVPTVGDNVSVKIIENNLGTIDKIHKRNNFMIRPKVANIDCVIITVAATSPAINYDLLDRFLVLAEVQGIENILICVNKSDLADEDTKDYLTKVYSSIYQLIFASTFENINIDQLAEYISGKVAVFAGASGVGKSSLINALLPNKKMETGELSAKIDRGKHTTRQVELLEMNKDTFIVDSPGFTSLSLGGISAKELDKYFVEFRPYCGKCRFNDCKHIHEPDCAIKAQVGENITNERYERYKALLEKCGQE